MENLDQNCNPNQFQSSVSSSPKGEGKMNLDDHPGAVEPGTGKEGGAPRAGTNHQLVLSLSSTGEAVRWETSATAATL